MSKTKIRKTSAVCLTLTLSCLQVQPLVSLPIYADEETEVSEETLNTETDDEFTETEQSDENAPFQEELSLEETEEFVQEVDEEKPEQMDQQADSENIESAAVNAPGIPILPGETIQERIVSLQNKWPEGSRLNAPNSRSKSFFYAYSTYLQIHQNYSFYGTTYTRPASIEELKPGDFVQVYDMDNTPHHLIVTSINPENDTFTGTDYDRMGSDKVSWKSTFNFTSIDYIVSPDNPEINTEPKADVDASLFEHNTIYKYKVNILASQVRDENPDIFGYLVLHGYCGDQIYLHPDSLQRPGYRLSGWKIRDSENYQSYWKYDDFVKQGAIFGIGTATKNGIKLDYYADSEGDLVFKPGNAFWADESMIDTDKTDYSHYVAFNIVPQ